MDQLDLKNEVAIVWRIDILTVDYVRESIGFSHRRRGRVVHGGDTVVGWADLSDEAKKPYLSSFFQRRVFWLADHDRYFHRSGPYARGTPMEGVDPLTVSPGVLGKLTDRALGRSG